MPAVPIGTALLGCTCWPTICVGDGARGGVVAGGGGGRLLGGVLTTGSSLTLNAWRSSRKKQSKEGCVRSRRGRAATCSGTVARRSSTPARRCDCVHGRGLT